MKGHNQGKLVLVIALCCFVFCLSLPSTSESPQVDKEGALKLLVERFFAACEKEDLEAFMSLWSEKSPDYEMRKKTMPQVFATGDYIFANLAVKEARLEGEKAKLRVCVDLTEIDPKTKVQSKRKLDRIFICVKEEGIWKI